MPLQEFARPPPRDALEFNGSLKLFPIINPAVVRQWTRWMKPWPEIRLQNECVVNVFQDLTEHWVMYEFEKKDCFRYGFVYLQRFSKYFVFEECSAEKITLFHAKHNSIMGATLC